MTVLKHLCLNASFKKETTELQIFTAKEEKAIPFVNNNFA